MTNKVKDDLRKAEEAYIQSVGWYLVKRQGKASVWSHPQYELGYSRNHAIQIAKAEDSELGYW